MELWSCGVGKRWRTGFHSTDDDDAEHIFAACGGVAQIQFYKRIQPHVTVKPQNSRFESLGKGELLALCDRLPTDDSDALEECIAFLEAATLGIWDGRARAMMARRLKHCPLTPPQRTRVVGAILDRLLNGRLSEQFKDQLRFVLYVAPEGAFTVARRCEGAAAGHVRRYAAGILAHETHDRYVEPATRQPNRPSGPFGHDAGTTQLEITENSREAAKTAKEWSDKTSPTRHFQPSRRRSSVDRRHGAVASRNSCGCVERPTATSISTKPPATS